MARPTSPPLPTAPRLTTLLVAVPTLAALTLSAPRATAAQLIPVRTVPVASGDQYRLTPSRSMGMGATRYALEDSLDDGWHNPARGGGRAENLFIASPTFYGISNDGGGGRSFPVSGLFGGSSWFGGVTLALQQVENDPGERWDFFCCCCTPGGTLGDRFGRNVFLAGFAGHRLGDGPWSVGAGISAAGLQAMDGVDLLYAGARSIEQSGDIVDLRLGLDHRGPRDRIGVTLVHNRVSMAHDVTYEQWVWNDSTSEGRIERRLETNLDRTRTWAGEVAWDRRLDAPGWRIGLVGAVNRKSHPKIPNYSIQNIPRDPGTTWAFEAGFGLARSDERTTFALDVSLQPIWSETWQEADSADVANSQGRLAVGDRSIENDFFFTNVMLRTGLSHAIDPVELQAGLEIRSYGYTLEQFDRVETTWRDQDESWVEWSPTLGAIVALDALDLRYGLRFTHGTGRPGVEAELRPGFDTLASGSDFLLAPGAPLTLRDARVVTHQIAVVIPVR